MAPVAGCSVYDTMASRRERALCRPMFPRFQLAYICARTRAVFRSVTRKRIYASNRLPYDPRADRGANLFGPRRRSPRKGCNHATIAPSVPRCFAGWTRERRGRRKSHQQKAFTIRDRSEEEGVTSRRDAVGMFSQAEKITCNHCERRSFRRRNTLTPSDWCHL